MKRSSTVILTATLALLLSLLIAPFAFAWDLRGASTAGDCLNVTGTISSEKSNPHAANAKLRVELDGRSTSYDVRYDATHESFTFPSGVPQDGKPHTLRVSWIDHDGDENSVNTYTLTCGTPPVATVPRAPATPPASSPPAPPSAPVKVCIPSGTRVDLHKTGPRSFVLTGKAHKIRWSVAGTLQQKGGKRLNVSGDRTGRLVVRYRANCQPGKLVGVVTDSPPPETAG